MDKFITGFFQGPDREYTINGVKYVVGARFEKKGTTLKSRISRCVKSDVIPLKVRVKRSIMEAENVCSAAGEED